MTNEERDIIDREAEKIINICTQFICELKLEYNSKSLTKQQRNHVDIVLELLANYLKAVYNLFNDQKNYRINRDLETYKFLKLGSEMRRDNEDVDMKIEYKDDYDLNEKISDNEEPLLAQLESEEKLPNSSARTKVKTKLDSEISKRNNEGGDNLSINNQSIEDDAITSRQQHDENLGLSAEDLQMLEIENKQMLSEFKGVHEEVQQIEQHVSDIAKLLDVFTEKVSLQKDDIDRISNTVVGATENVREANEQIKEAIQRNAGLRVYVLFFLLVMSFSLLFLDWYND
jgi:syntaxin 18